MYERDLVGVWKWMYCNCYFGVPISLVYCFVFFYLFFFIGCDLFRFGRILGIRCFLDFINWKVVIASYILTDLWPARSETASILKRVFCISLSERLPEMKLMHFISSPYIISYLLLLFFFFYVYASEYVIFNCCYCLQILLIIEVQICKRIK